MAILLNNRSGIALILVIAVILIVAIMVAGITAFVSGSLMLNSVRSSMEKALYAAQAGIYAAIYDYLADPANPYWRKARDIVMIPNVSYSVGKDADFLLVDADYPDLYNAIVRRINLFNTNDNQSITVDRMALEWANFPGASLTQITLGGRRCWSGSAKSGEMVTLSRRFRLDARQSATGVTTNAWQFSSNIPKEAMIEATFYFTDGSSRKALLYNMGRSGNLEFSVTATGRSGSWKRTVEATYDTGVNRITSWQETDSHI